LSVGRIRGQKRLFKIGGTNVVSTTSSRTVATAGKPVENLI